MDWKLVRKKWVELSVLQSGSFRRQLQSHRILWIPYLMKVKKKMEKKDKCEI
jgi:hypothetical protein